MCHIYMIVGWKHTLTQEIPYIMLSRRCNLKRTLRLILSLYVRKVIGKSRIFFLFCWMWHSRSQRLRSRQMTHELRQILDRIDL